MNSRRTAARSLVVPGALLLAVSFALAGCAKGSDSAEEGPITSRLNTLYGDVDSDQWRAENDRYEEIVAACMKENGFEYTPVPMSDDAYSFETWSEEDWDPVADAKENGYSITPVSKDALIEQYGLGEAPDEAVVDDDAGAVFADDDPNAAYYNSLSSSDQAAFREALWGPMLDEDDMGDSDESDWTRSGCHGEAFHEVYESQMDDQDAEQDTTVMDDFYAYTDDKTSNDPRLTAAKAAWASCMADKGYSFADLEEPRAEIQRRYDELTGTDSNAEEWTDPDLDLFSDEDITALHDEEIATATADAQCIVGAKLYDVWEKAYLDAETEFYNTHKTEVDAWFAAQEAAQKKD